MDIQNNWEKALKNTEIIRSRVQDLMTFADTKVPYIFLSESSVNIGDTVVRKGEILVEKPAIILPPNVPSFEGFDFEPGKISGEESVINYLLVRGVTLPSLKYNNQTFSLDIHEGKLGQALKYYKSQLESREDVHTGLVVGPEDCWQFSVLIFICSQVAKNAQTDIKKLWNDYRKQNFNS